MDTFLMNISPIPRGLLRAIRCGARCVPSAFPLEMKIVFRLSDANAGRLLSQNGIPLTEEDIEGLYLNIRYDGKGLTCITGTSLKLFTLDRTLELAWDRVTGLFLKRQGIPYEAL